MEPPKSLNPTGMDRLKQMTNEQLSQLKRKQIQFDQLTPKEQDRLRMFHRNVAEHENSNQLESVMQRYYQWLKTLDVQDQISLLDLPPQERIMRIKELQTAQAKQLFGTYGETKLPSEDTGVVFRWISATMASKSEKLGRYVQSPKVQKALRRAREANPLGKKQNRANDRVFPYDLLREVDPEYLTDVIFEDIDSLHAGLSQKALEIFNEYDNDEQRLLVLNWIDATIMTQQTITEKTLMDFYKTLSSSDHLMLDGLDPDSFMKTVRELYTEKHKRSSKRPVPKRTRMNSARGALNPNAPRADGSDR